MKMKQEKKVHGKEASGSCRGYLSFLPANIYSSLNTNFGLGEQLPLVGFMFSNSPSSYLLFLSKARPIKYNLHRF